MKYRVFFRDWSCLYADVEAKDEDEARDKAQEIAEGGGLTEVPSDISITEVEKVTEVK